MIESINNSQTGSLAATYYSTSVSTARYSTMNQTTADRSLFTGDTVSIGTFSLEASATYTSFGAIQEAADSAYELLRAYVIDIYETQGVISSLSIGNKEVDLTELSQEEAAALVAGDGYFGVEQTSDRIVDFAIGITGDDPSRLKAVLEGIERGFNEALEAFGGWLPDISHTTYNTVLEKLNSWAEQTQKA